MLSEIFPLNLCIIWLNSFTYVSSICVAYVYNHYHRNNQSRRSKMGLTSHLSVAYDAFSSSLFFSLLLIPMDTSLTNLAMKVLGPGSLPVQALFYFSLKIPLFVWVAQNMLVVWVDQNPLVMLVKYFPFVMPVEYFPLVLSVPLDSCLKCIFNY